MQEITNKFLGEILTGLAAVVSAYAVNALRRWMRRTDKSDLEAAAKVGVKWAAQTMQDALGKERFVEVSQSLAGKFQWADYDDIEKAIEAAVHDLNAAIQ